MESQESRGGTAEVRGPGRCSRPQQGPRRRRPLRAAVVRTQAIHDGALDVWVGERRAVCPRVTQGREFIHLSSAGGSRDGVQWVII